MRQPMSLRIAAVLLMAGACALGWWKGPPGKAQAAPTEVTARWRYSEVPEVEMAAVSRDNAQLDTRYRAYRRAWQIYQVRLHHCRKRPPLGCGGGPAQSYCEDRVLVQCLGAVIPALDAVRGALHDQAIGLEEAARRLAGATE
ncbi:MAG: hypothetical protein KGL13_02055 [Gammaproteobacteria bacterium]|nr:hypothetical protein [Gammaproteobacteria bacterium]MDE2345229.1 hypothetical protein [Gammaproteobacteria bacterium]